MKTVLFVSFILVTSCSGVPKNNGPHFQYKSGDKIQMWSTMSVPRTCDVLSTRTIFNYTDRVELAEYTIGCPEKHAEGGIAKRAITDQDLRANEVYKAAFLKSHPNWEKEFAASKPKYKPDYQIGDSVTYYDVDDSTTSKCTVVKIEDVGLGKAQIDYILECADHDDRVTANASLLKAGRKIASDRAAGKVMTKEQSFKETVKKTFEDRKQTIKTLQNLVK